MSHVKLLSIPTPARSRGCVRRCRGRGKGFPGGNPFRYVRFAATLLVQACRLLLFAILILPACLRLGASYFNSRSIIRAVRYGQRPRQFLDIYLPKDRETSGPAPVVICIMGGAWIIGHRLWNVLLARRLAEAGVMVVAVDYRNYPMATLSEMLDDLDLAMTWIQENISSYGGDLRSSAVVGQSAGAQLAAMLLLRQCRREEEDLEGQLSWSPSSFKVFLGVSGVYDFHLEMEHLESIGMVPYLSQLEADGDVASHSPSLLLEEEIYCRAVRRLCPVHLYHGEADTSVPVEMTTKFAKALQKAKASVKVKVEPGATHSEPVVEGPLGGSDVQAQILLPYLGKASHTAAKRFLPQPVLTVAKRVMPF